MTHHQIDFIMAIHWTCPSCGKGQFRKLVPAELSEDQRREMLMDHGIEQEVLTTLLVAPKRVRCRKCKTKFRTAS